MLQDRAEERRNHIAKYPALFSHDHSEGHSTLCSTGTIKHWQCVIDLWTCLEPLTWQPVYVFTITSHSWLLLFSYSFSPFNCLVNYLPLFIVFLSVNVLPTPRLHLFLCSPLLLPSFHSLPFFVSPPHSSCVMCHQWVQTDKSAPKGS